MAEFVAANNAAAASSPTAADGGIITAGARVRVEGLKAKPQLNGKVGTAVKWVTARGRWLVRVDGDRRPLGLKPGNLVVLNAPASTATAATMATVHVKTDADSEKKNNMQSPPCVVVPTK